MYASFFREILHEENALLNLVQKFTVFPECHVNPYSVEASHLAFGVLVPVLLQIIPFERFRVKS